MQAAVLQVQLHRMSSLADCTTEREWEEALPDAVTHNVLCHGGTGERTAKGQKHLQNED